MRITRDEPADRFPTLPQVGQDLPLLVGDLVLLAEVHGVELVGEVVRLDLDLLGADLGAWGEPVPPGHGYTHATTTDTGTGGVAAGTRWTA